MGKYSSDSDSEKRKSYKNRTKHRSSSSSSSDSRNKHKRKSDSRSRDRYSHSRSHSGSSARKSKSHRTSHSKDRSRFKDRHQRSSSKSRYRRSRSRSYIKEYTSKQRKRSTSSSSESEPRHDSFNENVKTEMKSPDVSKVDPKTLSAINEDGFTQKAFTSSKNKKVMENIVIDLKKQTIKVPEVEPVEPDSVFHHNLFLNEEARMEKWIKELYGYRQRALQQGLKTGEK